MAEWQGHARSNYVRIKDMAGLRAAMEPFDVEIVEKNGKAALLSIHDECGGWPTRFDADGNELIFADAVWPFMEEGEILVLMECGAEKLRYLTGVAQAFNSDGEHVFVSMNDIYEKAAQAFGVSVASISDCTY